MASGRKLIINWLIKSKAIKDDERELYEYALYSIVLLLSPAFISIAIGCIMGIPINGVLMVIPFLFFNIFIPHCSFFNLIFYIVSIILF